MESLKTVKTQTRNSQLLPNYILYYIPNFNT